ncbi:MAG TPA: STAS domain-containing protein [Actinomycetota bacterium]
MLRTEPLADGVGLRLSGELADVNAMLAAETFANLALIGGQVTLDMGGVPFMDSMGLGKLIVLAQGLSGRGHLRLVNVQPAVMRVFELVSPKRGIRGMTVEPAMATR